MARQASRWTQLQIARAVAGVRQGGERVAEITIEPSGAIRIVTTTDSPPPEPDSPSTDLDKAKARLREKLKGV